MAALLAAAVLAGCQDKLMPPNPSGGHLFDRYVAMGNSLTAGFESAGINDSTQQQSYAVDLARSMGTPFNQPLLSKPGCPPPVVNIFTGETLGGPTAPDCALRDPNIPAVLNDVAVPGAAIIDALSNLSPSSDPNALTTLMLGGRTQLEAARQADPTFVTMWLGNNDVLGAALSGDTTGITAQDAFAARYEAVADSIASFPSLKGAVLMGVFNVTLIPYLSPGAAYWLAAQNPSWPPNFTVNANCAPTQYGGVGETVRVPFGYGFGVLMAGALAGQSVELDCVNDPPVLDAAEIAAVQRDVAGYNQTIQQVAQKHDWAYWDPNLLLLSEIQAGSIPLFPNIPPSPDAVSQPFGAYVSKDGIHPSRAGYVKLSDALVDVINQKYGTNLQPPQ